MYGDVVDLLLEPRKGEAPWTPAAMDARENLVARVWEYGESILECANAMEHRAEKPRELWGLLADMLHDSAERRCLVQQESMLSAGHAYLP